MANRRAGSIAVTAGTDPADARHTLLHELAHWLTPDIAARAAAGVRRTVHHGAAFYATALPSSRGTPMGIEPALRREAGRYPSVLRHAAAAGIGEAARHGRRATRGAGGRTGAARRRVAAPGPGARGDARAQRTLVRLRDLRAPPRGPHPGSRGRGAGDASGTRYGRGCRERAVAGSLAG